MVKIGLVGYLGSGKSTVFELLTGTRPDPARAQLGQAGSAVVPDQRFDRLVELYRPKKAVPSRIELLDTPGLHRDEHEGNAGRLAVIREAAALAHVVGVFAGADPLADVRAFQEDLVLADLQVVSGRIERLKKDVGKARPDRDELQHELEALQPLYERLNEGRSLLDVELTDSHEKACRQYALLTRKKQLVVLNTADSDVDPTLVEAVQNEGFPVVAGPFGLELEVQQLPEEDRAEFAAAMDLAEPSREKLLRAVFEVTDQITFYTCAANKEVHARLLKRGSSVLEAAGEIHTDLARGFVRAEVWQVDDLLRLGSERELKAAGLHHVVDRSYVVQDGDEIFIRSGV